MTFSPAGRVVGSRYLLREQIGAGGMSEVFRAFDQRLERPVAVKILSRGLAADPQFVERFRREARHAAALSDPHIVAVYDWGEDDGLYYMVMEYVPGSSLEDVIARRAPLPEEEAAAIGAEIAGALAAAHARGVIHRDVKPHNVLLDYQGHVKVADFGIAHAVGAPHLTQAGVAYGSVAYASPEQIQGHEVGVQSDVYSLGVVVYQLLAGRVPFAADSAVAVAWQHVHQEPPPFADVGARVSAPLESVVMRALRKAPGERFESAADLQAALQRAGGLGAPAAALHSAPTVVLPVPPVPPPVEAASTAASLSVAPAGGARAPAHDATSPVVPAPRQAVADPAAAAGPAPAAAARSQRARTAWRIPLILAAVLIPTALAFAQLAANRPGAVASPAAGPLAGVQGASATAELATPLAVAPTTAPTTVPTVAPTSAPTSVPTVAPTSVPTVVPSAPASTTSTSVPLAAPTALAQPVPAPAPTPAPAPPAVPAGADRPAAAVTAFYEYVGGGNPQAAAALWSGRMQSQYPPAEFIYGRFAQTQQVTVQRAEVVALNEATGRATVAVRITEVLGNPPVSRRYTGTWELVRGPAGWLLDQPNLRPE